jgi:nicotinate phosphoribosyltransferase
MRDAIASEGLRMSFPTLGPLFTDFYELTMAGAYFAHQRHQQATFSLYIRGDHQARNYYVAAGLEAVIRELEAFTFSDEDVAYVKHRGLFTPDFLAFLSRLRFSGEVMALPEGTICFPDEPLLEVTAPVIEAQLLETLLLNTIGTATLLASKAARCVTAALGRPLVDFALRRTHGRDAGLTLARSSYLVGFAGTSNTLAGKLYGIPTSGTMAHSFVTAFENEIDAFRAFAAAFPLHTVLLIDTYDTLQGARHAAIVAHEMAARGQTLQGVRLDSGDMVALSREVRDLLDAQGLHAVKIFASSGFDEFKIAESLAAGAAIDAFGVGTRVGVSADAPYLDIVYKMVAFDGRPVRKFSPGKATLGGAKQVFRHWTPEGRMAADVIGRRDEPPAAGTPLLQPVMRQGRRLAAPPQLEQLRRRFASALASLEDRYKSLQPCPAYPVTVSPDLDALQQ